jgi:hypothetical protein
MNSDVVQIWRATHGIKGRLSREPRAELKGTVIGDGGGVTVKLRQGTPIVEYSPMVKIDRESMTGKLRAPADRVDKEFKRVAKDLAADNIKLTVASRSSSENPTYHLQGQLKLPDLLPGALKIAYLVAFSSFGDEFLDDPLNSQWQGVIRAKTVAELVIAYIALGAGRSFAFFPFMEPSPPWNQVLPDLSATEHRAVIYNPFGSGIYATVELMGDGLKIRCRVSRGASFDLPESTARAVICDAKASKVRFEEFSLSREAAEG